jgi:flavodoxin
MTQLPIQWPITINITGMQEAASMKILIVYRSQHRMNTQKVARAMAEATGATLATVDEVRPEDFDGYDLMGFGSGIYGGRHHQDLFALVERMTPGEGRKVFVFSTSGVAKDEYHRPLRDALAGKGCRVVGEFECPGEYSPLGVNLNLRGGLGWLAGKNRGRPDEKDLTDARTFARGLATA